MLNWVQGLDEAEEVGVASWGEQKGAVCLVDEEKTFQELVSVQVVDEMALGNYWVGLEGQRRLKDNSWSSVQV